jgi:hypothetical protein
MLQQGSVALYKLQGTLYKFSFLVYAASVRATKPDPMHIV